MPQPKIISPSEPNLPRAPAPAPLSPYELRPFPHFDEPFETESCENPIHWVIYGVNGGFGESLIARIAELSGRMPRRCGQDVSGSIGRGDEEASHWENGEDVRILWNGKYGIDGLFAAHETRFVPDRTDRYCFRELRLSPFAEEIDAETIENVELLLALELSYALEWVTGDCAFSNRTLEAIRFDWDQDSIERAVEVSTCGARRFGKKIPQGKPFQYTAFESSKFTGSVNAARAIAESGNAGDDALRISHLIGEIENARWIWDAYGCDADFGCGCAEMQRISEESGIDGFVRSYFDDGVPLDDILA